MSPAVWFLWISWSLSTPGTLPSAWWEVSWDGFPGEVLETGVGAIPATYHGREDWRWATYVATSSPDDPLPTPRFVLDRERYGEASGLEDVPIDVAEHLLSAVLEGVLNGHPAWRDEIERQAVDLVSDWPPELGPPAVRTALADFGGHLLSLALEIRRSEARWWARGQDPCPLARQRRLVFGLWSQAWRDGSFRPRVQEPGAASLDGPPLRPEHREWLVQTVLGRDWGGDPIVDLDLECPAPESGSAHR